MLETVIACLIVAFLIHVTMLSPRAAVTAVTSGMAGTGPFLHEPLRTTIGMDRVAGGALAKGLANLKAQVEA